MRKLPIGIIAVPLAVLLCGSEAAAQSTICMGLLTGDHQNVIVPEGAFCDAADATISGNVFVAELANGFRARRTRIAGNVNAPGPIVSSVRLLNSYVGGNVFIGKTLESTAGAICGSTIMGNLRLAQNAGFMEIGTSLNGAFAIEAECVPPFGANTFGGNVALNEFQNSPNFTFNNNGVGGNVEAIANAGDETISQNRISGTLTCRDNNPAPTSSGNSAEKFVGQCQM